MREDKDRNSREKNGEKRMKLSNYVSSAGGRAENEIIVESLSLSLSTRC